MEEERKRVAAYVEREASALIKIARQAEAPMLVYLIEMVAAEASEMRRKVRDDASNE